MIQITRKEFIKRYLDFMVINNQIKLSKREIEVFSELLFFNHGQEGTTPFKGEGRKEIRTMLDMSSQNYAIILSTLCNKGVLIKGQGNSNYNIHYKFLDLYYKILQTNKLTLTENYELIDE